MLIFDQMILTLGTRSSNLLRHLQKGFFPSVCSLPVSGYMVGKLTSFKKVVLRTVYSLDLRSSLIYMCVQFGRSIVCSDAAAEAARYGFTAIDRPEGFLVLAVASLGEEIKEFSSLPEVARGH